VASVAILDFGLTPAQVDQVLSGALHLVADGTRYSLREIAGTAWALRHARWRPKENVLAREQAFYCSAFVRHVFGLAGLDLVGGIAEKNTAPEHLAHCELAQTKWILTRGEAPASRVRRLVKRVRAKLR
jgi:hypothetical protein